MYKKRYDPPTGEPFRAVEDYDHTYASAEQESTDGMSLYELNALISDTLSLSFPHTYWVKAEISEMHVAGNGHCYLELVEKNARGNGLRAKASAHIWRSAYALIREDFQSTTGSPLVSGIQVLVCVEVDFHALYGFSLNIVDIDARYTLGDMARCRKEILDQLQADGILTMNKELPLPRLVQHIAVISSASAAGYGDFCNQLEQSPFRFSLQLFPAIMQGTQVEDSIIAALDKVAEADAFDAVVIIRGGGAVSDLSGFESYDLAANVAQFPIPVLTGIGHERDDTVIDFVAHTRLKTPTAVAAFLIHRAQNELDIVETLESELQDCIADALERHKHRLQQTAQRLAYHVAQYGNNSRQHLSNLAARLALSATQSISLRRQQLDSTTAQLHTAAHQHLTRQHHRLDLFSQSLAMADPARILRQGFSITMKDGHVVRDAATLQPGDRLTTTFEKGTVESIVRE